MKNQLPTTDTPASRPLPPCDDDGFLLDPEDWNRGLAKHLAMLDGIGPLQHEHWTIIYYLREHHLEYGSLPPMSQICRTQGMDRHAVQRLFGGCRRAWRIAGLGNPGEEAKSYM